MNKILIGLSVIIFVSCTNFNKNKVHEKMLQDSITNAQNIEIEKEKARKDSIHKRELKLQKIRLSIKKDSITRIEQIKVIGDIKFGMSKNQVVKRIKKFTKENTKFVQKTYKKTSFTVKEHLIGNYRFDYIDGSYYNGKLYELIIHGFPIDWEYFDIVIAKEIEAITNIIKLKYGKPDSHSDIKPRYKYDDNYSYLINSWTIGTKEIEIRIVANKTTYNVRVVINQPEIEIKIEQEELEQMRLETKKNKDVF